MKRRALRGVALVTLAQFLSFACGTRPAPTTPPGGGSGSAGPPTGIDAPLVQTGDPAPGLTMRLSDGRQGPAAVDHSALAKAANLSNADVAQRRTDEVFPWEHITAAVRKNFLFQDFRKSLEGQIRVDCRLNCFACGILPTFAGMRRENPGDVWKCPDVKSPASKKPVDHQLPVVGD